MEQISEFNAKTALAENSLAGCILIEPTAVLKDIRGLVGESDFQGEQARAIFAAASQLVAEGKAADPGLIQATAAKQGREISTEYAADLMRLCATVTNAPEFAKIIHDEALKRRGRAVGMALADGLSPSEAVAQLQDILQGGAASVKSPADLANEVMDYINDVASGERQTFLPTRYASIDNQLSGGLVKGGLITIAARPGTGKSTIALAIGDKVAQRGGKVLYISLEMTEVQLWSCRLASYSGLSRSRIYDGMKGEDEKGWKRLVDAFQALSTWPFYIRAIPSTVEDIEREARCIDGLELIIVDHIGLVTPMEQGSAYDKMTNTSHRLKQLALSLKIPIIGLCQLNRQSESRSDKRPTMADLRDSGAVEEDSDVVALLFRPAVYTKDEEKPKPWESQDLQIIVDKNRHGATGVINMQFCGMNSRIMEGTNARDDRLPD